MPALLLLYQLRSERCRGRHAPARARPSRWAARGLARAAAVEAVRQDLDGSGLITVTQESDEGDVVIGSSCDEDLAVGQGGDGVSVVVASEADRGLATDTEGGVEDAVVGESHDDKVLIDTVV